jgi:hypothetical protein
MQQKQTIQVLEDSPDTQISGLYTAEYEDYLINNESVITVIDDKLTSGILLKLCISTFITLHLAIITILKTISWLNRLGGDEVDVNAIEASHDRHHSSSIQGMTH